MADDDEILDDDLLDDIDDDSELEIEASEPEQTTADPVVDMFRKEGFDIPDGMSGSVLLSNIREMARRAQSAPSEMDLARMREASARYEQEREAPKQEQPEPPKKTSLSKPEGAEQYVVFDDKVGMYVPKDARFPNIKAVEEMNSWHQQVESRRRRLLEDPENYLKSELNLEERLEQVKKSAREEALQEFRRLQEAERREAERNAFWDKHSPDLYVLDDNGYVRHDLMGKPTISQKGLKYLEFQGAILQKYPNADPFTVEREAFDMADKWEKAEKRRQARSQSKAVEQEESTDEVEQELAPEDVAESQKQVFARKARAAEENGKRRKGDRVINRDASVVAAAKNGEPQNDGAAFRELFKSNAKTRGVTL